mmetsp:Transcript_19401/g.48570  ORF Transcript_19401/g.48570 Transcript_19401/m.48570 type:complete len:213 (-) Transcript_19401:309-947(-)
MMSESKTAVVPAVAAFSCRKAHSSFRKLTYTAVVRKKLLTPRSASCSTACLSKSRYRFPRPTNDAPAPFTTIWSKLEYRLVSCAAHPTLHMLVSSWLLLSCSVAVPAAKICFKMPTNAFRFVFTSAVPNAWLWIRPSSLVSRAFQYLSRTNTSVDITFTTEVLICVDVSSCFSTLGAPSTTLSDCRNTRQETCSCTTKKTFSTSRSISAPSE